MKKFFKKQIIKIFFLTITLMVAFKVSAKEEIENACKNSDIGCAFCVYNYAEEMGCYFSFSVTYRSDGTPLEYKIYSNGSNTGYVNCAFDYSNFAKEGFLDSSNNIKCPNANVSSEITSSYGRTANKKLTIKSSNDGKIIANESSTVVQNKESTEGNSQQVIDSYSCKYGSAFNVSIIDNKVNVILNGNYIGFTISHNLNVNSFANNKCPDLWYYANTRGSNIFSIYDHNPGSSYYTKIEGTTKDENTGEIVTDYNKNELTPITPTEENCVSLLGSTTCESGKNCDPAFYIQIVFNVMKYAAIILLIVLSSMDFLGAVTSSDDGAMKKAMNKCIKRLIICVIIFFVPTLLEYIFTWVKVYTPSTCGIK